MVEDGPVSGGQVTTSVLRDLVGHRTLAMLNRYTHTSDRAKAEAVARLDTGQYDFIVLNFANMDMVGHTGVLAAAVKACETVDRCLDRVLDKLLEQGGTALVTADHGNSEKMVGPDGKPYTAHTTNPVRLLLVGGDRQAIQLREGRLGDIAPTLLEMMGLEKPEQMAGRSLLSG